MKSREGFCYNGGMFYRRNADRNLRDLERQASSGDSHAQSQLLGVYIRTGKVPFFRVRMAADLGHPIARQFHVPKPNSDQDYFIRPGPFERTLTHLRRQKDIICVLSDVAKELGRFVSQPVGLDELVEALEGWVAEPQTTSDRQLLDAWCDVDEEIMGSFHVNLAAIALQGTYTHSRRPWPTEVSEGCLSDISSLTLSLSMDDLITHLSNICTTILEDPMRIALVPVSFPDDTRHFDYQYERIIKLIINGALLPEIPLEVSSLIPDPSLFD